MRSWSPPPFVCKLLSSLCFAVCNGLSRTLTISYGVDIRAILCYQVFVGAVASWVWRDNRHAASIEWGWRSMPLFLCLCRSLLATGGILAHLEAIHTLSVTKSVTSSMLGPAVTLFGSLMFLKEKLSPGIAVALVLSLLGTWLQQSGSTANEKQTRADQHSELEPANSVSTWLPFLSTFCFASVTLVERRIALSGCSAVSTSKYMYVFMIPVCVLLYPSTQLVYSRYTMLLLLLTASATVAGQVLGMVALHSHGVLSLAAVGSLRVLVSVALGISFFNDSFSSQEAAGCLVIFTGSLVGMRAMISSKNRRKIPPKVD